MKAVIILLCTAISCFSQVNDSLLYQLKNISNDTERVNQLYKIGFSLRNSAIEDAFDIATYCEQAAIESNSSNHLAKAYNLLGVLNNKVGKYQTALSYQNKSLYYNHQANNALGIAHNQTNIGNIYASLKKFNLAEQAQLKALNSYNAINNKLFIAKCLQNIGELKFLQANYMPALQQYKQALGYAAEINDYELMANCNNNIAATLINLNHCDSAIAYLQECEKYLALTEDEIELADCYNNYANIYIHLFDLEKADFYITKADSISNVNNYWEMIIELYDTKALYCEKAQNYKEALLWSKKYHHVKDSLANLEVDSAIDAFQEAKQNNSYETKTQTSLTIYLTGLFVLSLGILLFLFRFKR